ncbi:MAG: hypothetical protein ACD_73C00001G0001, partial [uncultured bacterium]
MRIYLLGLLIMACIWPDYSWSGEKLTFPQIWDKIESRSPEIRGSQNQLSALQVARNRQSLAWLPKATITGKAVSSNDPTLAFMTKLNQRSLQQQDFQPANLNEPGFNSFLNGSLLLDLPLYQGGAQTAMKKSLKNSEAAYRYNLQATKDYEFAESVTQYGLMISSLNHKHRLESLMSSLQELLGQYELGSDTNPIGHSGLLGLKSLRNHFKGMINETSAKTEALKTALSLKADLPQKSWSPVNQDIPSFIKKNLGLPLPLKKEAPLPAQVKASFALADSLMNMSQVEKAKLLPRVGLFGQGDLTAGSRNTATNTTVG